MTTATDRSPSECGFALLTVVVFTAVLLVAGVATMQLTRTELHSTAQQVAHQAAFYEADAGVQRALAQLHRDRATAATSTGYTYGVTESLGRGSYTISVVQDPLFSSDPTRKQIQSVGLHYGLQSTIVAHAVVQAFSVAYPPVVPTPTTEPTWTVVPGVTPPPTPTPPGPTETPGPPPPTSTPLSGVTPGDTPLPPSGPTATPGGPTPTPTPRPGTTVLDCPTLLFSNGVSGGAARIVVNLPVLSTLFNGDIFGNANVSFNVLATALFNFQGNGNVFAVNDFVSNSPLAVLTTLNASLYRGGNWTVQGTDAHLPLTGAPILGIHFWNGAPSHHGVPTTVASRRLPIPDYARIKRDPDHIPSIVRVINKRNYASAAPGSTWDNATDTWEYSGTLVFGTSPNVIYYVQGNANLGTISVACNASASIVTHAAGVAPGWLSIQQLNLVTTGLTFGGSVNLAAGPSGAAVSSALQVAVGTTQTMHLIAQDELSIGRSLLSKLPVTFDSENNALLNTTTGIGLSALSLAVNNNIFAESEKKSVWAKLSMIEALGNTRVKFLANRDATLGYNGTIGTSVSCYPAAPF